MVYQQRVEAIDDWGNPLSLRRITIKLDQPTEDGDIEIQIQILTNLPNRLKATRIAEASRGRWKVEGAFGKSMSRFVGGLELGKFDVNSPEELLRTITERRVCSAARFWQARRRDVRRNAELGEAQQSPLVAADPTPSQSIAANELVAEALARLPEQARQMVHWRQDGLGWAKIAERIEGTATPEAVRKQYERALQRVAVELGLGDSC